MHRWMCTWGSSNSHLASFIERESLCRSLPHASLAQGSQPRLRSWDCWRKIASRGAERYRLITTVNQTGPLLINLRAFATCGFLAFYATPSHTRFPQKKMDSLRRSHAFGGNLNSFDPENHEKESCWDTRRGTRRLCAVRICPGRPLRFCAHPMRDVERVLRKNPDSPGPTGPCC
jgi:hypothetical protein